jgi:hypothetical protein
VRTSDGDGGWEGWFRWGIEGLWDGTVGFDLVRFWFVGGRGFGRLLRGLRVLRLWG